MSRRIGHKQRNRIYPLVIQRDGDCCLLCATGNPPRRSPAPPGRTWELDHADSNRANWAPHNVHAVCHAHHEYLSGLSPGQHYKEIMDAYVMNMREREHAKSLSGELASSFKLNAGYKTASPEMIANEEYERQWLDAAFSLCLAHPEGYPVRFFINDCARYAGCARTTSKNYYEVHVLSPTYGLTFQEARDMAGNEVVKFRESVGFNHNGNGHKDGLNGTVEIYRDSQGKFARKE